MNAALMSVQHLSRAQPSSERTANQVSLRAGGMGGGWFLLVKETTLLPSAAGGLKHPALLSAGVVLRAGFQFCVHLTFPDSPYNGRGGGVA
jgi:hypothetical protein